MATTRSLSACVKGSIMLGPLLVAFSAAFAAPGEVTGVASCPGTKDCFNWTAVSGATSYHVYRGARSSLACLLNPAFDSCTDGGSVSTTTTGNTLIEIPAPGQLFWFLITADDGTEGTCGAATPAPRDSQHGGACLLTCGAAGSPCSVSADCCSAGCIAGTCQAVCCAGTGGPCALHGDCCSGVCSSGSCAAPCNPPGGSCSTGADCCNAANATGTCGGSVCGLACNAGHANCNAIAADGCECAGNICCAGSCEPPHVNGLGQSFDDCAPLGVPGTPSTYSNTMAVEARAAWPIAALIDADCLCGTAQCVYRQTLTSCATWVYTKTTAGHVSLNTASNTCACPTTADPTWQ